MMKRAVLYARVSTDEQADRGYSLATQLDLCRKYAERLGFQIVGDQYYRILDGKLVPTMAEDSGMLQAYVDDYTGVIPIAERPEGKKLVALLKAGRADTVIVYQVDRLSRDIVDLLSTVRQWLRSGWEIHTCDIGKVESELDIVLVIKGWQGSDERKKIIERTTRGRNGKARSGKVVGTGFAPYGYRYLDNQLVVIEEEAGIVRLIYTWYVQGEVNEQGEHVPVATLEICRRLQKMGAPVPSKNHFWRVRTGLWNPSIIHKILKNETYAGVWRFGKNIGACGRGGQRSREEQIPVNVPALVDRKLWDAAQAKRDYNVMMSKRRAHQEYLLRSLVKCNCGRRMIGLYRRDVKIEDPRYYYCSTLTQSWRKRECMQRSIRASVVESCVWKYITGIMEDAIEYERILRQAQQDEINALRPKQEELETVEKLIEDCELEVSQCATAMIKASGAVGRALEAKSQEVNARYDALSKRRDELKAQLAEQQLTEEAIDAALVFRDEVLVGMQSPSPIVKRRVLEMLGVEVRVQGTTIWVSCRVGKNSREFDSQIF